MSTIRTKFKIDSVTQHCWGGESIKALPVTGGSTENQEFWKATPNGSLEITINNTSVQGTFKPGDEYYIDLTKAS